MLSLFDGISCGRLALERANIPVERYYASEIDCHAIKVTQHNFPDNIQLGNVENWRSWEIDWSAVDLLIGGSPCQGFSSAGKLLNFDDQRSRLFFVYSDILAHIGQHNPNVKFLLENVKMKQEWMDIISNILDCNPIEINSSLVSAQNRVRLYWTNIANIEQPLDKEIFWKNVSIDYEHGQAVGSMRGRYLINGKRQDGRQQTAGLTKQYIEFRYDGKTNCVSTVAKDNVVVPYTLENRILAKEFYHRSLLPIECERLQTIPDDYTSCISSSQRCKLLGNAWTVDVVAHIFNYLFR